MNLTHAIVIELCVGRTQGQEGMIVICMTPGCERRARIRGVCEACRQPLQILVNEGKTTWDELAERGVIAPKRKPGFNRRETNLRTITQRFGCWGDYLWA